MRRKRTYRKARTTLPEPMPTPGVDGTAASSLAASPQRSSTHGAEREEQRGSEAVNMAPKMEKPRATPNQKDGKIRSAWNAMFRELDAFKAEHGHCNVPQSHGSLGGWVHSQRQRKLKMSEDRLQKLVGLGFNWGTARGPRNTWGERLEELAEYKAQHGNCDIPQRQGSLGSWVSSQRTARKKGKLSDEQIQKLDELGFHWGATFLTWEDRLEELTSYEAEHGHCNVPQSKGALAKWVYNQRTLHKKGKLSAERVKKLHSLGFNWGTTRGTPASWDERLEELMSYTAEHGHCNPPRSHESLGEWVRNQRVARRKDKLSPDRIQRLDDLGFNWGAARRTPAS